MKEKLQKLQKQPKFQKIKNSKILQKLGRANRRVYGFYMERPLISTAILAFLLNLIMECLGRRNPLDAIVYLFQNPIMFFYNVLIIMMTLSVALLFRRRVFMMTLISIIWLSSAVANCVLLGFRTTPFSAIDLTMVSYALSIIDIYLSKTEIILVIAMFLVILGLIIYIGFKAPKHQRQKPYIQAVAFVLAMVIIVALATGTAIQTQLLSSRFGNLADAYKNYGFAYCLSNSFIDSGIDKPENYSKETVDAILADTEAKIAQDPTAEIQPNVIFLQMESFFDPNYIKDLYYSRNPIPNYEKMKAESISGFLTVPTVSAGTANTEFEVLTGMSVQHFGAGEYPYKTVLLESTCESVANNLAQLGYATTAIHNNRATFYGRNEVYPNLGFNTFISKEYMMNLEYTPVSWVKDKVLTDEIMATLNSSDSKDLVFTVSVQGHGKYPTKFTGSEDYSVYVYGEGGEERIAGYSYLINQYYEMDMFLGELTAALEKYDEDTVLVVYGDHLPGLDIDAEDLTNNSLFQTEYVIWSNFGLSGEDKDIYSYDLSSYVLELLGIHEGVMNRYHQTSEETGDNAKDMELLEYDMLYGENYSHGGENPYTAPILQMGIYDITVDHAVFVDGDLYVFGNNLTEASSVFINDEMYKTSYYNANMVVVREVDIADGDSVCVKQAGKNKRPLSSSNEIIFTYQEFEPPPVTEEE